VEENFPKAIDFLKTSVEASKFNKDYYSLVMAQYHLATAQAHLGAFEESLATYQNTLKYAPKSNNSFTIIINCTISNSALFALGQIDYALKNSKDNLELGQSIGDIATLGFAHFTYGRACYYKGWFEKARNHLLKAVFFSDKATHLTWGAMSLAMLAHAYMEMKEWQNAVNSFDRAIASLRGNRLMPSVVALYKVARAISSTIEDSTNFSLQNIASQYEIIKWKQFKGWAAMYIADFLIRTGSRYLLESESWVLKAIENDERYGQKWHLGQDYAVYAEFFKRKGDRDKAKENLNKAIEILMECGADGWVEKYKTKLADLG
jgi:tetratricopeptide (TPR) repeat protein